VELTHSAPNYLQLFVLPTCWKSFHPAFHAKDLFSIAWPIAHLDELVPSTQPFALAIVVALSFAHARVSNHLDEYSLAWGRYEYFLELILSFYPKWK
jgi:hypothetical protein